MYSALNRRVKSTTHSVIIERLHCTLSMLLQTSQKLYTRLGVCGKVHVHIQSQAVHLSLSYTVCERLKSEMCRLTLVSVELGQPNVLGTRRRRVRSVLTQSTDEAISCALLSESMIDDPLMYSQPKQQLSILSTSIECCIQNSHVSLCKCIPG